MTLLYTLLNGDLPEVPTGPITFTVLIGVVYSAFRGLEKLLDYLRARELRKAEEREKEIAKQAAIPIAPFIPESLEARIFRIEKDKIESDLKEEREENERLRSENIQLHKKNSELYDLLIQEQKTSAQLRLDLHYERERRDSERARSIRDRAITDPMLRPIRKP